MCGKCGHTLYLTCPYRSLTNQILTKHEHVYAKMGHEKPDEKGHSFMINTKTMKM